MSYENIILNMNSFTDETVTGNFTILADTGALLDFHKCADLTAVIYTAAIGIHKIEYFDIFPDTDIVQGLTFILYGYGFHV